MESQAKPAIKPLGKARKRSAAPALEVQAVTSPVRDRRVEPVPLVFRVHTFGIDERRHCLGLPERSRPGYKHVRDGSIDALVRSHMGAVLAAKDAGEAGSVRDLRIALVRVQRLAVELGRRYAELTGNETRVVEEPLDAMAMDWLDDRNPMLGDLLEH